MTDLLSVPFKTKTSNWNQQACCVRTWDILYGKMPGHCPHLTLAPKKEKRIQVFFKQLNVDTVCLSLLTHTAHTQNKAGVCVCYRLADPECLAIPGLSNRPASYPAALWMWRHIQYIHSLLCVWPEQDLYHGVLWQHLCSTMYARPLIFTLSVSIFVSYLCLSTGCWTTCLSSSYQLGILYLFLE